MIPKPYLCRVRTNDPLYTFRVHAVVFSVPRVGARVLIFPPSGLQYEQAELKARSPGPG
jgi:hypothetical protein